MAITVTATQVGSPANGMALRIFILTGAAAAAAQTGAAPSATFSTSVTSFTATGVVQQASSFIYGAVIHGNSADTASGGTTVVDDIADATNGERYCTFKKITGVTAGSQALGTTAGSSTGGAAWLEALASGTLAEDTADAPAVASTTAATAITSASFTPPPGSLLVALVSADGGSGVNTVTVTGGGYAWTEKSKANGATNDYAGVWIADGPAAITSGPALSLPALRNFPVLMVTRSGWQNAGHSV